MSDELLINVTPQETRVARIENGMLQEVVIERASKRGLVGNIYRGKVCRVLPGMQAAFLEIGLERTAFLHLSDIVVSEEKKNAPQELTIGDVLRDGQEILVQVVKDPMGTKGARLTTHITIPARYLVYMPNSTHIGVSQKLEDDEERERLKELIKQRLEEFNGGGYIVRTVAEGISEKAVHADMIFLQKLWQSIQENNKSSNSAKMVYEDLPLAMKVMRDIVDTDIDAIRIDSRETFNKVIKFANKFIPELAPRIEYYPGERPIFDLYGVEDEIQRALQSKVKLKSGGYLIIDQTEAMTTVDINTGGYVGNRNLEETIFKTNLEATQAIVRQLRLRNLGGIIIIDFIDMTDSEHRRQVLRAFEKALERDHAKTCITEVSNLGLVEMTRKRTRESLEHILCEECPVCNGKGTVKTVETVAFEIFREIIREARQFDTEKLLVLTSQNVGDYLMDEESSSIAELEEFMQRSIQLKIDNEYNQEQYDVVPM
ncbi:MAG: ribonuclease G [gamma proteobacterium symbiont of Bathyaustriella thionipta]|nr:ribonuclease G [gamma proteobacterium symbiont of Bathyaustriella thionipta]MCU7948646.1 ribonuclease G [gamma proteobacterium symbiont of Bathyaustriella thionipta]MCU7953716.1 ribonuclease G [gamma proteobacterium symbiont of Bathyaustriella thionipta]MCU7955177.1 ribonuclease G [gamma proteobacterium symbiont of Bathyaustriella thionipta]MCU7968707.1 ribonuclease G [gamma proteobacterium symbiont of Bathyaustriella thionipta]